jgi:hypothetical protein
LKERQNLIVVLILGDPRALGFSLGPLGLALSFSLLAALGLLSFIAFTLAATALCLLQPHGLPLGWGSP